MFVKKSLVALCLASAVLASAASLQAVAADSAAKSAKAAKSRTFDENQFIGLFSHKTMKQVTDVVGKPARTAQASKPSDAEATLGRPLDKGSGAKVEMWYYQNLVRYDDKHTYKTVELTFVNDRCMNIAFFNDR
jgi:opacity protein-like surface antigen